MLPTIKPGVSCKRAEPALDLAGASISTRLVHAITIIIIFIISIATSEAETSVKSFLENKVFL